MKTLVSAVVCVSMLLGFDAALPLRGASAQPASSDAADDLYRRANEAYDHGKLEEAYALYTQAFALKKSFDIAGNLGHLEAKLGKHRDAAEHIAFSLSVFPPNGNVAARDKQRAVLATLKQSVGTLTIETNVPGATIVVDGKELGSAPLGREIYVDPGSHTIEAKRTGYRTAREDRGLTAGASAAVKLNLVQGGDTGKTTWPGWLLLGTGAGVVLAGIGTLIAGEVKRSDADGIATEIDGSGGSCEPELNTLRCQDLKDAGAPVQPLETASAALLSVGGALLVSGIVYLAVPGGAHQTATLIPWIGPRSVGLVLSGRFD